MPCVYNCSYSFTVFFTIVLGVCFLVKLYVKLTSAIFEGKERLDGKTIIVTGASSGIGAESVKDFARRGARVVMLCRDMVKGGKVRDEIIASTRNKNLVIKHIDFESFASVRKCANEILAEEGRIDVLVNNAGMGAGLKVMHIKTEDGLDKMMQTNHFGPFLFTNLLLGRIKESSPSRIVNVSSIGHYMAFLDLNDLQNTKINLDFIGYANSKLANIYFSNVLAEKLKGTGVTSNSLHPGVIVTDIDRDNSEFVKKFSQITLYNFYKNIYEGAQTTNFLCVCPSVANVTGKYFSDCKAVAPSKAAQDYAEAEKLWNLSEKIVNLQESEKHY